MEALGEAPCFEIEVRRLTPFVCLSQAICITSPPPPPTPPHPPTHPHVAHVHNTTLTETAISSRHRGRFWIYLVMDMQYGWSRVFEMGTVGRLEKRSEVLVGEVAPEVQPISVAMC